MTNTTFIFDGISSTDMGLYIVRINGGEFNSPYISSQDIVEQETYDRHVPHFFKTRKRPLEFELTFTIGDEPFTPEIKYKLARWLIHEEYKEFQTTDDLTKIYNVIAISDVDFISFGTHQGYFTIRFRCDAPWAWTRRYLSNYDLSAITAPTIISMDNLSNIAKYYYPEIEFTLKDTNTGIQLRNLSDGGRIFKFEGLTAGETIYINNERKSIISDIPATYRLSNFNKGWFRLTYGKNNIEVTGKCMLQTRMKFPIFA